MWKETTKRERNMKIFREELDEFLPTSILDFHVHILNSSVVPAGERFDCAGHPIEKYDLEDLTCDLADLYPGRAVSAVCFGFPDVRYDLQKSNNYLAEKCDGIRFFPFRLFDPHESSDAFQKDLETRRFVGIKPYPDYVRRSNINDVEIREMLPDWAMETVNALGLIVMLHIPRKARLADPLNQSQIIELCAKYPRAKIVLAHIGRAYFLKNITGNLENLKDIPNLFFDLTMVSNWEVLEYLFQRVDGSKIFYGTDIPLGLAPGKSVEINDQYTYVTPVAWHLSISDDHGKLVFTSFIYEEIRAIKKAVQRLGLGRSFVEGMFYSNGMRLLTARNSI
ncbi:MAG TPA: amidohydrolase family protein [bacterium]|nr:amidohydrolase family protein [bacterium]